MIIRKWECNLAEYLQRYQVLLGGATTGEIWILGKNNEDLGVIQLEDNCESVVLECDQDEDTDSDEIIVGDTEPADEYEQHPYLVEVMIDYNCHRWKNAEIGIGTQQQ